MIGYNSLSNEQQQMINVAYRGRNVLVDACIGSGKTTSIQVMCNIFNNKRILYLTYNKLLKVDAKAKITARNVFVQNYHGFAFICLNRIGVKCGMSDLIQTFLKVKPPVGQYDLLVIDEYQDIEQELAEMLVYIKQQNPNIQIIAVGDMQQKIYDKTSLDVAKFIQEYLGDFEKVCFTKCFRLSNNLAATLGRVWQKPIIGVNQNCIVRTMNYSDVVDYLLSRNVSDILCLGAMKGAMSSCLNTLETRNPQKFNKTSVYARIREEGAEKIQPSPHTAIFTTFDAAKGLERPLCCVFDFTSDYWETRNNQPMVKYDIMRNIFCVAASRGKYEIIFVKTDKKSIVTERELSTPTALKTDFSQPFYISEMFDFKYKEDVEECYSYLKIKKIKSADKNIIDIQQNDALIDISQCIGVYQEASYFTKYDLDEQIEYEKSKHKDRVFPKLKEDCTFQDKVLYLAMCSTLYERYIKQVQTPFVTEEETVLLHERLGTEFEANAFCQKPCTVTFTDAHGNEYTIDGRCDVIKNNVVYELKYVSEFSHEHYLQAAMYAYAMDMKSAVLWNIRTNEKSIITIKDKKSFFNCVIKCITKGFVKRDYTDI